MSEFRMPSLGADMDEGTLVEWLVAAGDPVHRGDIVAVVDTAKSAIEIEVFEDGVVDELLVPLGTTVPVGAALARLRSAEGSSTPTEPQRDQEAPTVPPIVNEQSPAAPTVSHEPAVSSPLVRHLAHERGVDLTKVTGSGDGGQ